MLTLKNIVKKYVTGDQTVVALKGVDISFRDNEFVSILGPSGCGKTTLLNIIGGLDQYDEGDLVIDGRSTKDYSDADWDSYRNHSVGFVFQSYNLIPHQTVLSNVELALTLSGVSKSERRARAADALKKVGLEEQINKRPNQLSGGQMQRVAIARALVNNPSILLADEPTGALDSETSVQIMDILKEISEDRLVVMVTHNPDLADEYSTRIVRLLDGKVIGDTNPCEEEEKPANKAEKPTKKKKEAGTQKTSMSFLTALSLSMNNLLTKKGRTILTSFAGSIGIIGIALILAISTGFQAYVDTVQENALSSYPINIISKSVDFTSLLTSMSGRRQQEENATHSKDRVYAMDNVDSLLQSFSSEVKANDLASFKKYLDEIDLKNKDYVNSINYTYDMDLNVFREDISNGIVQVSPNALYKVFMGTSGASYGAYSGISEQYATNNDPWKQLINNTELLHSQYDVVAGKWPENYNEIVLILNKNNEIMDTTLYGLGLKTEADMMDLMMKMSDGEKPKESSKSYSYEEIMDITFRVVPTAKMFEYDEKNVSWTDMSKDEDYLAGLISEGIQLKIVGILRPSDDTTVTNSRGSIGYLSSLTEYVINETNNTQIVKQQRENPQINVFTGEPFKTASTAASSQKTAPASDEGVTEQTTTAPAKENVSAFKAPSVGTLEKSAASPGIGTVAVKDNMTQEEIYAYIDEHFSGKQREDMRRLVELVLKTNHTEAEKEELIGDLDKMIEYSNGRAQQYNSKLTDGEAAYKILMNMLPSARLRMVSNIIQRVEASYPNGYPTTEPTTQEKTTKKNDTTTAPNKKTETTTAAKKESDKNTTTAKSSGEKTTAAQNVTQETTDNAAGNEPSEEPATKKSGSLTLEVPDTYESNLQKLGAVTTDNPSEIYIYPVDFESKDRVIEIINEYNQKMTESGQDDKVITYTDYIGALLSSITKIINTVSIVLIAFVAVSLVVSSIMIGIITYISVIERTKEIGILRSIGASKRDISRVFNAETAIVGFTAGAIGIGMTLILMIPINILIHNLTDINAVAQLNPLDAILLVVISIVLTLISGLIPASIAAKKDPVDALRTE